MSTWKGGTYYAWDERDGKLSAPVEMPKYFCPTCGREMGREEGSDGLEYPWCSRHGFDPADCGDE